MTLPVVGNFLKITGRLELGHALLTHPPVTKSNADHDARLGNAEWQGNTLVFGKEGRMNYWFIPEKTDGVSYAVVQPGFGKAYVLSPNFAGCHLVWLWNAALKQMAFLHVYKGTGPAVPFEPATGWEQQGRISSIGLQAAFSPCPVWAIACVDRAATPWAVEAKFIGCGMPSLTYVKGFIVNDGKTATNVATGAPPVEVLHADPGTTITD